LSQKFLSFFWSDEREVWVLLLEADIADSNRAGLIERLAFIDELLMNIALT